MTDTEKTVLLIEDEQPVLRFLRASIEDGGFRALTATSGKQGLDLAAARKPDVILLDLGLPDIDGIEVLKRLRAWSSAPVIIVSARGQEADKIAGLDSGADDYLTKPFSIEELLARIRVALRHAERPAGDVPPVYKHEDLKIDLASRHVWLGKKEVRLSPLQYNLLAALVRNAGRVVSQAQLIKAIWGPEGSANSESLRILVHQTRHRIERNPVRPRHLKTEPAVGYRLAESDD